MMKETYLKFIIVICMLFAYSQNLFANEGTQKIKESLFDGLLEDITSHPFILYLHSNGISETYSQDSYQKLLNLLRSELPKSNSSKGQFLKKTIEILEGRQNKEKSDKEKAFIIGLRILYTNFPVFMKKKSRVAGEFITNLPKEVIFKLPRKQGTSRIEGDVDKNHPLWLREDERQGQYDLFENLENYHQQMARQYLKNPHYDFLKESDTLFIDKIKNTSTNPKLNAHDAYGLKWKVKFGDEIETAAIASRLYILLGGKFTDLSYVKSLMLVLPENYTFEKLHQDFLNSRYHFNIMPYIKEKGMYDSKREYIVLYRSVVSFEGGPYALRGGPIAQSDLGARDDLAFRGVLLFHAWIGNKDVKDDNGRGYLLKSFGGNPGWTYVESQHDVGFSFSDFRNAGRLNDFRADDFITRVGENIYIQGARFYVPTPWYHTTYTDVLWMAKKIVSLSNDQIRWAVSSSKWPSFMQEILSQVLIKRRNDIAKVFDLELSPFEKTPDTSLDYSFPLSTRLDRIRAAQEFNLDINRIEQELKFLKLLKQGGDENTIIPYTDYLAKSGIISLCNQSILINLLENSEYPNGLSRRSARIVNSKGLPKCQYH